MSALCAGCLTGSAQPQGDKVYSYFALGILMTMEMSETQLKQKLASFSTHFSEPGVLITLFGCKSELL